MTDAARPHPGLDDPQLWRQLAAVASIYGRGRWTHLRDEFESACNFALAKALDDWRPDGGSSLRSYATLIAHRHCQEVVRSARPKGYRSKAQRGGAPVVASLEGMGEAREMDPAEMIPDNGPGPDHLAERAELAEVGASALGPDAEVIGRWMAGEGVVEIAASLGVSKQRVAQRIDRGIIRARKRMDRATRVRDRPAASASGHV
jgi:RNA polymerase sigma factor (sigma-70 family)